MIRIQAQNVWAKVIESTPEEEGWLDNLLKFQTPDAHFLRTRAKGDGYVHLYDSMSGVFPAGLIHHVWENARADKVPLHIDDLRVCPCPPTGYAPWPTWFAATDDQGRDRRYQQEAAQAAVVRTRGILKLPTGAGKTRIAVAITERVPVPWLIYVPGIDLLHQFARDYTELTGAPCGRFGDGLHELGQRVDVATYQSVFRWLHEDEQAARAYLRTRRGFVADEAHTIATATAIRDTGALVNAYWRIGLSATPLLRTDRRVLCTLGSTGSLLYEVSAPALIDAGIISRPIITMPVHTQDEETPDWPAAERNLVLRSPGRNALVTDLVGRAAKPGLVFVRRLPHGRALTKALQKAGIKAEFVWGSVPAEIRRQQLDRLVAGKFDVIVCNVVFQQGIDCPELRSIVIAGGGRSEIATIQRVGRGVRTTAEKSTVEIWDILDRGNKYLERHADGRLGAYKAEGYDVTILDEAGQPTARKPARRAKKPVPDPMFPPI